MRSSLSTSKKKIISLFKRQRISQCVIKNCHHVTARKLSAHAWTSAQSSQSEQGRTKDRIQRVACKHEQKAEFTQQVKTGKGPSLHNEQRRAKGQVYTVSKNWQRTLFTQGAKTGKGPSMHSELRRAKGQVYTASKNGQKAKFIQRAKTGKGPSLHSE